MIFKGIAPSIRSVDPNFLRYELSLNLAWVIHRFSEFNIQLVKAFSNFGESMKQAAEGMSHIVKILNKEDSWPNLSFKSKKD